MGFYEIAYIVCGILFLVVIIIGCIAQNKVNGAYKQYKDTPSSLDLTGAQLAMKLSNDLNVPITVKECRGTLSDHYNPKDHSLNISSANYNSKSIAAQAVVAHEFGHALQHANGYAPLKIRQYIIWLSGFISKMFFPMIVVGALLDLLVWGYGGAGSIIIYLVVLLYAVIVFANIATLKVEYDASDRAKKVLVSLGADSQEEVKATNKLLSAAALTYVSSLLVSIVYLLSIILMAFDRR